MATIAPVATRQVLRNLRAQWDVLTAMKAVVLPLGLGLALCAGCGPTPEPSPKGTPASKAEPAKAKAKEATPKPPAADVAKPGVRDDGTVVTAVKWFEGSLEQALAAAKEQGKLVFVDVGAYWCPPCHEMDEKVFVRDDVAAALAADFIAIHIDAEKADGPELVESHHIQAYPTFLVLEASGVEKGRFVDFVEPPELLENLAKLKAGGNLLASLEEAASASPDDPKKAYALGHAYALVANKAGALAQFEVVLAADPKNEMGLAAKALYDRAQFITAKLEGSPKKAISELEELQKRFPGTPQAARAFRKIGRMRAQLGDPDGAIESLDALVALDPENVAWYANYGWFCFRQNVKPDAGLKAVKTGIEKHPEDAELRYLAAELHRMLGQKTEAVAAIRKASELEPKTAYYRRSIARFESMAAG